MSEIQKNEWSQPGKFLFRVVFLYFFIQSVPVDWKFYQQLFSINWSQLHYGDIFNIAHYTPQFYESGQSYGNWIVVLLIAFAGAVAWTIFDRNKARNYQLLYYWLRVIVRYRLAIGIIAYGFLKFFPLQSPYPSISNLNTPYGDFTRWKIFSLTLGIVPSYELFLGIVEIVLGVLLFYRKTASISAFIIIIFTGNVFMSNIAYEGGEHVYSLYLITLAIFVLFYDLKRIISLLILQKPTAPNRFKPVFAGNVQKYGRWTAKLAFIAFFVVLYGFKTRSGYQNDQYQFPQTPGLAGVSGVYNVAEFLLNNDTIAYSKTDPLRWQDVVFEKWNTISIRSNRPVIIDSNNIERIIQNDQNRTYELEGSAARHYYSYETDTVNHLLKLHNKNKNYQHESLVLQYATNNNGEIVLKGLNENKDSVFVVLNRINKKYVLEEVAREGRRKPMKL